MAQRRFHYEQAFEHYLRANRVPYVAVDEAKKALMPAAASGRKAQCSPVPVPVPGVGVGAGAGTSLAALKSFDFVVYATGRNLLVDVKGRMFGSPGSKNPQSSRRLESWVTMDDVESLLQWQALFGSDFQAVFVFAYCLRQQPPDALFEELFTFGERWYALREVTLADYQAAMVTRSTKWQTVHVPAEAFDRISRPFTATRSPGHRPACGSGKAALC